MAKRFKTLENHSNPALEKVFGDSSIDIGQFLQDHPAWELRQIWKTEVTAVTRQLLLAKSGHKDLDALLTKLSAEALSEACLQCLAKDTPAEQRRDLIREICSKFKIFGEAQTLSFGMFKQTS